MYLMLLGLVVLFGAHAFTTMREQRAAVIAKLGEAPYKGLYSLVSIVGLLLVAYGYDAWRVSGPAQLWVPPVWTRHLALVLMIPASVLFVASYVPSHIRTWLKHPMLVGIKTWAIAHLIANGDIATIVLAVAVLASAVYARISMKYREQAPPPPSTGTGDAVAVVGGLVLFAFLAYLLHPYVIGVSVMP